MNYLLKQLLEYDIIDYQRLVLRFYHKFNLTEQEAVALIKLHDLLEEKEDIIDPKKFSRWVSTSTKETEKTLESLMTKGYLKIKLITDENDKEKEVFDIDFFVSKVVDYLEKKRVNHLESVVYAWVQYLEDTLQKPLTPLDMEIVSHWIDENAYTFDMVKEATMEALKRKHPTIRVIDQLLLKKLNLVKVSPKKKTDVLKEFHALWDE